MKSSKFIENEKCNDLWCILFGMSDDQFQTFYDANCPVHNTEINKIEQQYKGDWKNENEIT